MNELEGTGQEAFVAKLEGLDRYLNPGSSKYKEYRMNIQPSI
jgi:hypothetical protein